MLHEGYFDKIYYRFWQSDNENKNQIILPTIFAIHGLGGHNLWFDNAGEKFNKRNINFFSFDLPGFGQSKYEKGTINSYKLWLTATHEVFQEFTDKFKTGSNIFILGHSLGALIAIMIKERIQPKGWILSVPGFAGYPKTWPFFSFILPVIISSLFNPEKKIILPFGPELLTKNKETQMKVKKDPLRVTNPTSKLFYEVYLLTLRAKILPRSFNAPVLMLEAGKDFVCSNQYIDKYFNDIKSKSKSKKVYTNSSHDLFIEDELEEIVNDIYEWIKQY